jgi:hypothetical protein
MMDNESTENKIHTFLAERYRISKTDIDSGVLAMITRGGPYLTALFIKEFSEKFKIEFSATPAKKYWDAKKGWKSIISLILSVVVLFITLLLGITLLPIKDPQSVYSLACILSLVAAFIAGKMFDNYVMPKFSVHPFTMEDLTEAVNTKRWPESIFKRDLDNN